MLIEFSGRSITGLTFQAAQSAELEWLYSSRRSLLCRNPEVIFMIDSFEIINYTVAFHEIISIKNHHLHFNMNCIGVA